MSEHRTVQHDLPAEPHPESREETIERVVDSHQATGGRVDPSTRRGVNFRLWRALTGWALAGAIIGAVAGVILSFAPGPFETSSVAEAVGYAVVLAFALAIVFSMIGSLITLEREDGRVERDVERRTERPPAERPPDSPT